MFKMKLQKRQVQMDKQNIRIKLRAYDNKVLDQSSGVGGSNGYTFRLEGNGNTGAYIAFSSEL